MTSWQVEAMLAGGICNNMHVCHSNMVCKAHEHLWLNDVECMLVLVHVWIILVYSKTESNCMYT